MSCGVFGVRETTGEAKWSEVRTSVFAPYL